MQQLPSSSFSSSSSFCLSPPASKIQRLDIQRCEYCGAFLKDVVQYDLPKEVDKVVITDYQLFDYNGHLRSISDTIFETEREKLYLSGRVQLKELRPTAAIGPIVGWELESREGSEVPVPVLVTEECAYHLGSPLKAYEPFAKRTARGIEIGCAIRDFIEGGNRGAEYEDMISYLTSKKGIMVEELFSEYFVIFKFVFLYDVKKNSPPHLMDNRALKTFAKLTGFDQYIPQQLLPKESKVSMRTKRSFPIQKRDIKVNVKETKPFQKDAFNTFDYINVIFDKTLEDAPKDLPRKPFDISLISLSEENSYRSEGERAYYMATVHTRDRKTINISTGDYAMTDSAIYKVLYLYKDSGGRGFFHGAKYIFSKDTPFLAAENPNEIFAAGCCEQVPLESIVSGPIRVGCKRLNEQGLFYWDKVYIEEKHCYANPTQADIELHRVDYPLKKCHHCDKLQLPRDPHGSYGDGENCQEQQYIYSFVMDGFEYNAGCYGMFDKDAWETPADRVNTESKKSEDEEYLRRLQDPATYPEISRKVSSLSSTPSKGDNLYKIGRIENILKTRDGEIVLGVSKLFRPQDVPYLDFHTIANTPLNELYYTSEFVQVPVKHLRSMCRVEFGYKQSPPSSDVFLDYVDKFFCTKQYNVESNTLSDMEDLLDNPTGAPPPQPNRLKILNVFGCGGFASGVASGCFGELKWGFESDPSMISTLNGIPSKPRCFKDPFATELARMVKNERASASNTEYPVRGDYVDVITASLPGDVANETNSTMQEVMILIARLCPRFIVLDGPEELASPRGCLCLRRALSALRTLNYQFRFGVLDCAHFGVPQVRKRAVIIAAAEHLILPEMPSPITYSPSSPDVLTPIRRITVYDAVSDLPEIEDGKFYKKIPYKSPIPQTTFQLWARYNSSAEITSHTTIPMPPIDKVRLSYLPSYPGADWRDLPNIDVDDGTAPSLHKIAYKDDRSVCTCAGRGTSQVCSGGDRVGSSETLIPWCLVHTAGRNGGWEGAVGRLEEGEGGMFAHVAGFPVSVGENGRVFHPRQNRFCSLREFARGQGFPDKFMFYGSITDKHRAVGSATPLLLGQAIGREILRALDMMNNEH